MTGIDDPYEAPTDPELSIDCGVETVQRGVERVIARLTDLRVLPCAPPHVPERQAGE